MPDLVFAFNLLAILLLALIGGFVAKKFRQPLILGYVLSGIIFGGFLNKISGEQELITSLAEVGVALLIFSLGVEFSFARLARVKKIAIWGGLIQILSTTLWGLLIFPRFGFDFYNSLFLASCFSLSSTAVVTKVLSERGEMDTLPGEIMLGWLLIQDLAVLPMILLLPQIANLNPEQLGNLLLEVFKASFLLLITLVLGKSIVPKILSQVAATNSREILILSVVTVCLSFAFGTFYLGLSFSLGAFLAGLLVSESAQNHAVFSEIRPLRDIFSIIFFVSLGTILSPVFLMSHFLLIISLSIVVLLIKFIVTIALTLYLGYHFKISFIVGMGLVGVGEFSFVLARMGISHKIITSEVYAIIISVAVLTIVLTPFFLNWAPRIYNLIRKITKNHYPVIYRFISARDLKISEDGLPLKDHVVVCGFGRVGGWLGRALMLLQVPFVVIDYNHEVVNELRDKGVPVVYGDPADIDVLDYAQVDKAKSIVIAIPDRHTQEMVIFNALHLNPKINVICRIHHQEDKNWIKAMGVRTVIQPEFEASLSIIHRVMQDLGMDKVDVSDKIKRIKIEYGMN